MRRSLATLMGAATTVAALGVSGCADHDRAATAPLAPAPPAAASPSPDPGPLPAPEALIGVIYRLADPAVPGPDKLSLVRDAAPADAGALDQFAAALRDTGFAPVTVTATDLRWSPDRPGDVLAAVTIAGADDDRPAEFSFPMAFGRTGADWQLTRDTAGMLLAFGDTGAAAAAPPPPATPPP